MEKAVYSSRLVRFGTFEVDLEAGELRKAGLKLKLTGQPFQVLSMLLERPGAVVTREELQQRLWPDSFVDVDHNLNTAINKIREVLDDSSENPRFVETLPRRGYRFIAQVNELGTTVPMSSPRGVTTDTFTRRVVSQVVEAAMGGHRSRKRWRVWTLVAAITVAALAAVVLGLNVGDLRDSLLGRATAAQIRSIAVLPLEGLSNEPEQEYFADGMTDALITDLGKISALRVISRTSTMQYKGTKKPVHEIAGELNVDAVLEGTVVRAGEHVRVSANLIQASPERHLWAESYERDLRDILVLQSEVAQAIASQIRVKVTPQEKVQLTRGGAVNPEAYEFYLQGRFYWNRRSPETIKKALYYMNQAIAKDPNYALAYAGLADCYGVLAHLRVIPGQEAYTKGTMAALRALELDPQLAEPHALVAGLLVDQDFDWAGAEAEFKRAIGLNPNYATGHQWYGIILASLGRVQEAREQLQVARGLDPLSLQIQVNLADLDAFTYQSDLAIEELHKVLEMDPNLPEPRQSLALVYEDKGMYGEAAAEWHKFHLLEDREEAAAAWENVTDEARYRRAGLRELALRKEQAKKEYVSPLVFAELDVRFGEKEQALAWLEKAYQERSPGVLFLKMEPLYDPLRSDPRFQNLLRLMKFPQ